MVSIFTGLGTGFERGSVAQLGAAGLLGSGALGRNGEQLSLNAATGNLLIRQQDEFLVGRGQDASVSRTYNSLGDPTHDDNGDRWQQSTDRRVYGLTGTLNTTGSAVKRLSGDGSEITYTWNSTASAYVATDGAGAYDKLVQSGSGSATAWTWTDGDSQVVETYSAYDPAHPSAPTSWRITSQADTSGNTLSYSYVTSSSHLDRITTQNGEYIAYSWDGSGNITDVVTHYDTSNASTSTRTHYAYTSNKLTSVTVDLTPDDNSVTDGAKYVTTYAYDANGRVSSITETDGSSMAIVYDSSGRVSTLTQTVVAGTSPVTRATNIAYGSGYTTITDQLNQVTRLDYDSNNRLTKITLPADVSGGTAQVTQFRYDSSDNVTDVTDLTYSPNKNVHYDYDSSGNVLGVTDPLGNVVTRTYDSHNHVLTETTTPAGTTSTTSGNLGPSLLPNYTYWGGNETASAGTLTNGAPAYYYTGTSSGLTLQSVGVSVTAGDTITYELTLKAGTTSDAAAIDTSSGACSVIIVTGPGTVTNGSTGSWADISGLSSTLETRIRVTRTVTTSGLDYLYFIAGASTLSGSARAGLTIVVGDPSIVRTTPAASTIQPTTRYTYDSSNRLEYTVSAEGRVTHHSYDANGNDTADQIYIGGHYDVSALANSAALTSTQIATWVSGLSDKTQFQNIERTYDARGNLSIETEYSASTTGGLKDTSGGNKQTTYVYDQRGQLRSRHVNGLATEYFLYDGLGRITTSTDLNGATTHFVFNDSATQTVVTYANNRVETSTYNKAGELLNTTDSLDPPTTSANLAPNLNGAGQWLGNQTSGTPKTLASGGTAYEYTGPSSGLTLQSYGVNLNAGDTLTYQLTLLAGSATSVLTMGVTSGDNGDTVYSIAGAGSLSVSGGAATVSGLSTTSETRVTITRHATTADTEWLYFWVASGQTVFVGDPSIVKTTAVAPRFQYDADGQLRVATDKTGKSSYFVYDHAGRKVADVDQNGDMVEYVYDANDRLVETISYANQLTSAQLATVANASASFELSSVRPGANADDLKTWKVYDADGRVIEAIDGAGGVTTFTYDGFGRLVTTTAYAKKLTSLPSAPPTSLLLPTADSVHDNVSRIFYDKDGLVVGTLNGEGSLTKTNYDDGGQKVLVTSFATRITDTTLRATGTFAALLTAAGSVSADRTTRYVYNNQGQLRYEIDAFNYVTEFSYRTGWDLGSEIGDVRTVIRYATAISAPSTYTVASIQTALSASPVLATAADNRTSYAVYDAANRLAYAIDASGAVTGYSYDGLGQLIKTIQFATLCTTPSPDLTAMTSWQATPANVSANDRVTRSYFDLRGRIKYAVDGEGFLTRYDYDAENRVVGTTRWDTAISVNDATTTTSLTPPSGDSISTSTSYDNEGRVATFTSGIGAGSAGVATSYHYNPNGTLDWVKLAADTSDEAQTKYSYDGAGRKASQTEAFGTAEARVTSYGYDGLGDLVTVTDPHGTSYNYYDHLGRVISTRDAENYVTELTYNSFGEVSSTTRRANIATNTDTTILPVYTPDSARDATSFAYYDAMGRVTSTRDADNRVTETSYNAFGEVQSVARRFSLATGSTASAPGVIADSRDAVTSYVYDKAGRVHITTDAANGVITINYNAFSQIETELDPFGASTTIQTTNTYDRRGLLKTHVVDSVTGGKAITTTYEMDAFGRQIHLTNALTKVSSASYDRDGRLISSVDPLGNSTGYKYDKRGNLVAVTDAAGKITRFVYDRQNRKVGAIDALGAVSVYTYDTAGNLTTARTYSNKISLTGLALQVTSSAYSSLTAMTTDHVTYYTYDNDGRLRFTVDALGQVTERVYDAQGNVVHTTAYDGAVTPGPYSLSSITAAVAGMPSRGSRSVYDAAGQLMFSIDAENQVTGFTYDALGRVTKQVEFAATYGTAGDPTVATMTSWVSSHTDATKDRTTRAWYDGDGRLRYSMDALGYVTRIDYNKAGNVTTQTAYADANTTASSTLDTTTTTNLDTAYATTPATARVTQFGYDRAGRLETTTILEDSTSGVGNTVSIVTRLIRDQLGQITSSTEADGTGDASITTYVYDDAGRMVKQTRGDTAAEASTSWFFYDALGRKAATVDGDNYLCVWAYDAAGQMTGETHYANKIIGSFGTASTVADLQALAGTNTLDAATATEYDALGRVHSTTDARGSVTTNIYDAIDELGSTTQEMESGTGDDITIAYTYDHFGNVIKTVDPRGNASFAYYDKLHRVIRQVDAEHYVTGTSYTRDGQISSVTRWATALTGAVSETAYPGDPATDVAHDATTSFGYDKDGRLTDTVDAEGDTSSGTFQLYSEHYTLDAFGNRIAVKNKLGGTTSYTFDKRGLVLTETLPSTITTKNSSGTAIAVVNSYGYDLRGNRIQMIEAAGALEARTTTYSYDKLDRLTQTDHDLITIVNDDLSSTASVAINEKVKYDRRGNVIETIDAAGAHTLRWYDALDHMTYQIVQTDIVGSVKRGMLTRFTHDANGNIVSSKIYGDLVTLPSDANGSVPTPVDSTKFHETKSTYDRANRLSTTKVESLLTGESTGTSTFALTTADVVSSFDYDKAGNVVHQQDGRGNNVYTWYDKLGRQVAQVDAENYLTVWTRDAEGNALSETRYANKVTGAFTSATAYAALPSLLGTGAADADRITQFTYDRDGRRTEEKRLNVAYTAISATGVATDYAATDGSAVSKINYTYNGLGQVLSKTEANIADITVSTTARDTVNYAYDAIGRLVLETGQAFKDYLWTSGAANATPLTAYAYDGLNNLRSTRVQTAATANDTNDRITSYTYGAGGRLATMTDAAGFVHTYGYDKAGRTIRDSYDRIKADGSSVTEASVSRYDLAGRVIMQTNARLVSGVWSFTDETSSHLAYDAVWTRYDAYGQMTGRGRTAGASATPVYQEMFDYDAGGRLWHTNSGNGVDHFYVYDKDGNRTLELTSTGADLSALTLTNYTSSITSVGGTSTSNAATTITAYDKRGKAIATKEVARSLTTSTSATIVHGKAYNAFGEVIAETDPRGYDASGNALTFAGGAGFTTTYTYNTMGRLLTKVMPQVSVTAENGSQSNVHPTEYYSYDLSGRLVSVVDADGHRNTRLLLAGTGHGDRDALITKEFHPDSGVFETRYDVFGDVRKTINEVGSAEDRSYDKIGRLITETHAARPIGSVGNATGAVVQLVDHFVYDGLGQRTGHWNSQFTDSSGAPIAYETADFDVQGRVTSTVNFAGEATNYTYSWNASVATTGLGMFGGWIKTTSNIGTTQLASESQDYFGRTVDEIDFGNHNYDFTFDKGGRLTARTNDAYESIGYSYYNTGLIAGQTGTQGTATYQYDAAGNRLLETFANAGTTWRNDIASYDALGRMTSWTDRDISNSTVSTTAWEYDAVGNVRRTKASYHAVNADGTLASTTSVQDYWYLYDAMNRFTLTKGQLGGTNASYQPVTGDDARGIGTIGRGQTGTAITYNLDGNRATALYTASLLGTRWAYYGNGGGNYQYEIVPDGTGTDGTWTQVTYRFQGDRREDYVYTADGYLARTAKADAYMDAGTQPQPTDQGAPEPTYVAPPTNGGTLSTITRDALGRITGYIEQGGFDGSFERSAIIYDRAGRELSETSITIRRDTTGGPSQTYTTYTTNTFVGGLQTQQLQHTYKNSLDSTGDSAVPDSKTFYSYEWWDGALQKKIENDNDNSGSIDWTTTNTFDASGHITQANIADGQPRNVNFVTDQNGQIIDRLEVKLSGNTTSAGNPHTIHYNFGGLQMGEVGNNGTDNIDYAASIANRLRPNPGSPSPFASGEEYYSPLADFDQSYDAINGASTAGTGGDYTVSAGDTLVSIAQAVWGDGALWYLIADANGLSGTETLAIGRVLNIPNKVHNNRNSADTWRPYDPNEALGDINPTSAPQPPKRNSCGVFGQILLIVIAVAVTAWASPASLASMTFIQGMLAGVAGSVASQLVGLATGIQQKFDFKGLALAAIAGGISGGISEVARGTSSLAKSLSGLKGVAAALSKGGTFVAGVERGVVTSALTQGIGVATGLQSKFDFMGVAAAGLGGGITQSIHLGGTGGLIVKNAAAGLATSAVESVVTGRDFGDTLMASLPSIIGNTIGSLIGDQINAPRKTPANRFALNLDLGSINAGVMARESGALLGYNSAIPPAGTIQGGAYTESAIGFDASWSDGLNDDAINRAERGQLKFINGGAPIGDSLSGFSQETPRTTQETDRIFSKFKKYILSRTDISQEERNRELSDNQDRRDRALDYFLSSAPSPSLNLQPLRDLNESLSDVGLTGLAAGALDGIGAHEQAAATRGMADAPGDFLIDTLESLPEAARLLLNGADAPLGDGESYLSGNRLTFGTTWTTDYGIRRAQAAWNNAQNIAFNAINTIGNIPTYLSNQVSDATSHDVGRIRSGTRNLGKAGLTAYSILDGGIGAYGVVSSARIARVGEAVTTSRVGPDALSGADAVTSAEAASRWSGASARFSSISSASATASTRKIVAGTLERGNINVNIEGGVPAGYAGHHLIGIAEAANYPVMQRATELGYNINRGSNGIALPTTVEESLMKDLPLHNGRHLGQYTDYVDSQLAKLQNRYDMNAIKDRQLVPEVGKIEDNIRQALLSKKVRLQNADPRFNER